MLEGALGVETDTRFICIRSACQHHVAEEILGLVDEAVLALSRGPAIAAEIDVSASHGARSATARADFQERDAGSCSRRFDCCRGARGTEADHDDVALDVPCGDVA